MNCESLFHRNQGDASETEEGAEDLLQGDVFVKAERTEDEQPDGDSAVGANGTDADAPATAVEVEEASLQPDDGQSQQIIRPVEGADIGHQASAAATGDSEKD